MNSKKELVQTLINSLTNEWQEWSFNEYTADYSKNGLRLWIANWQPFDLKVYKPTIVTFSLMDRYKLYSAMDECRAKHVTQFLSSQIK